VNNESVGHFPETDDLGSNSAEEVLQQICREPVKEAIVRASLALRTNWSSLTHLLTQESDKTDSQRRTGNATSSIPAGGSLASAVLPQAGVSHTAFATRGHESNMPARPNSFLLRLRWTVIALLTVVCGGYTGYRFAHAGSPWMGLTALNLSVDYKAHQLVLRWNPNANAFTTASSGSMSIHDGKQYKQLHMTLEQLLAGKLLYSPSSDDVSFRLDVLDSRGARTGSDSIRAVGIVPPSRKAARDMATIRSLPKPSGEEKPAVESPGTKESTHPQWSVFPPQAVNPAPE
jgi:hypothetical protein